jgi:hypothetical protein
MTHTAGIGRTIASLKVTGLALFLAFVAPGVSQGRSFGVVSFRNETSRTVYYRYFWEGDTSWQRASIPPYGTGWHVRWLRAGERVLPQMVVESDVMVSDRVVGLVTKALEGNWYNGSGPPTYRHGMEYVFKTSPDRPDLRTLVPRRTR